MWIYFLFGAIVGFGVGYFVSKWSQRRYDGEFVIDSKYENKTVWFLNVNGNVDDIQKRKSLRFKVKIPD